MFLGWRKVGEDEISMFEGGRGEGREERRREGREEEPMRRVPNEGMCGRWLS